MSTLVEFRDAPQMCHDYILDKVVSELEHFFSSTANPTMENHVKSEKLVAKFTDDVSKKNAELEQCEIRLRRLDQLLKEKKEELKRNKKAQPDMAERDEKSKDTEVIDEERDGDKLNDSDFEVKG